LRGKGRAILLGERMLPSDVTGDTSATSPAEHVTETPDPAALRLTPEEMRALFDISAPLPGLDEALPVVPPDRRAAPPAEPVVSPRRTPEQRARSAADEFLTDLPDWSAPPELVDDVPVIMGRDRSGQPSVARGDAPPLAEREPSAIPSQTETYQPHAAVEALTPPSPETWSSEPSVRAAEQRPVPPSSAAESLPARAMPEERPADTSVTAAPEAASGVSEAATIGVDDERIRRLARQIEALQEDLARHPTRDPQVNDGYQQELAEADRLLSSSRANYDTVRATVYRIRTEIARQRKIEADIARYRPLLLNYLVGWAIALVVLFLLKALFAGVGEAVGVPVVAALYYPLLFGIAGALLTGYLTLERHTTRLRDFDPIHISWYLVNPLLGGVMGLLMFLIATLANQDLLHERASDAEVAITYLLCVIAGMNQTPVLHALHEVMRRLGRNS
jgi:hypothetical protein